MSGDGLTLSSLNSTAIDDCSSGRFFTVARRSPYRASAIVNLGFLILGTAVSTSFKRRLADLV
jgi:hypothetical protein